MDLHRRRESRDASRNCELKIPLFSTTRFLLHLSPTHMSESPLRSSPFKVRFNIPPAEKKLSTAFSLVCVVVDLCSAASFFLAALLLPNTPLYTNISLLLFSLVFRMLARRRVAQRAAALLLRRKAGAGVGVDEQGFVRL